MAGNDSAKLGRAKPAYLCSAPEGFCNGKKTVDEGGRTHSSAEECLACSVRALQKQGYKRIGSRQFEHMTDPTKPVLTLDKHALRAKPGKQENAHYSKSSKMRNRSLTAEERNTPYHPKDIDGNPIVPNPMISD